MKRVFKIFSFLSALMFSAHIQAQQSLLLVGGGLRAPVALKEWISASPTSSPRIMIITWASALKKADYEKSIMADLSALGVKDFLFSRDITNNFEKSEFIQSLSSATHIFFSGGNQTLIMNILNQNPQLMNLLKQAYWKRNIPVAGTSAGTGVQAELMITGDNQPLEPGLGFLPESVIDQHFFKRARQDRLRTYMNEAPDNFFGVGVDEDGSILFKRDPKTKKFKGQVLGDKKVMIIDRIQNGKRNERILGNLKCIGLFR